MRTTPRGPIMPSHPLPGLVVLCSHHPPRISLHSVHDGALIRSLSVPSAVTGIAGVWWLDHDSPDVDLMRRGPNTVRRTSLAKLLEHHSHTIPASFCPLAPRPPSTIRSISRPSAKVSCFLSLKLSSHASSTKQTHPRYGCSHRVWFARATQAKMV